MKNRLILPRLLFHRQADIVRQFRLAHIDGPRVETARVPAVVDADGDDVVLVPFDEFRLHDIAPGGLPLAGISPGVAGIGPGLTDPGSVQEGLVRIVDGAEVQEDLVRGPFLQGRRDDDVDPVPGVSVGILDALQGPVLLQRQDLPAAVVETGLAPGGVVPLPETAFAHENLGRQGEHSGRPKGHRKQKSFHNRGFVIGA